MAPIWKMHDRYSSIHARTRAGKSKSWRSRKLKLLHNKYISKCTPFWASHAQSLLRLMHWCPALVTASNQFSAKWKLNRPKWASISEHQKTEQTIANGHSTSLSSESDCLSQFISSSLVSSSLATSLTADFTFLPFVVFAAVGVGFDDTADVAAVLAALLGPCDITSMIIRSISSFLFQHHTVRFIHTCGMVLCRYSVRLVIKRSYMFDSRPFHSHEITLGKLFACVLLLPTVQFGNGQRWWHSEAGQITAGLIKSNSTDLWVYN